MTNMLNDIVNATNDHLPYTTTTDTIATTTTAPATAITLTRES